ncbi:syntaxin-12-like [Dermacentor andersoni]|uniref:syntaxin-12-like n=1 Tax=Dermacentor andersoni TaxID=34620 RepID=UPI0021554B83|nr:syntaxin-12-like [Dermacentor andersoni]XP_054924588.1 syntaxin-12-like [Dermacentor andersoni]
MATKYANFSSGSGSGGSSNAEFQSLSQTIGTNVQKISQNVGSMKKMVQQLGTSQDSESLRSQLHQIQQYTNQLAKDTNAQLKALAAMPYGEQGAGRLLREKLTNDFSEALHHFQLVQRAEADKEKDSVKRARAASGIGFESSSSRGGGGNLIELASPVQAQQQAQSYAQMDEQVNIEMLREREQSIRKLENDIVDVNAIFKDLATLVHDQGDMIDSIEANVESAAVHVEEGIQQVAKARQHQERARKKMFCLLLIGVIVLATLITIIVVSVKR